MTQRLSLTVNGRRHELDTPDHRTLLQLVREDLHLPGTKDACRQGVCGSCTVLVDGVAMRACLTLAARCNGKEVTTVEGLAGNGAIDRLQQAFLDAGAIQCGYCTPGMLMSAAALLRENPAPTAEEVREALIGNLCRCTGYGRIVRAVVSCGAGNAAAPPGSP